MRKKIEHMDIFAIGIVFLIAGVGCIALPFLFSYGDFIEDIILTMVGVFFLIVGLLISIVGVTGGV